jgi:hypothetical protein
MESTDNITPEQNISAEKRNIIDPFYSTANQERLVEAVTRLNAGKGSEHELLEVE